MIAAPYAVADRDALDLLIVPPDRNMDAFMNMGVEVLHA